MNLKPPWTVTSFHEDSESKDLLGVISEIPLGTLMERTTSRVPMTGRRDSRPSRADVHLTHALACNGYLGVRAGEIIFAHIDPLPHPLVRNLFCLDFTTS